MANPREYNANDPPSNPLITLKSSFLNVGASLGVGSFITDPHFGDPTLTEAQSRAAAATETEWAASRPSLRT